MTSVEVVEMLIPCALLIFCFIGELTETVGIKSNQIKSEAVGKEERLHKDGIRVNDVDLGMMRMIEHGLLYGEAAVCPAMTKMNCTRNEEDGACCNYQFESDDMHLQQGVERFCESHFIKVPPPKKKLCFLRKKIGRCRAAHKRVFYNAKTNKCEPFRYGGCRGNRNNFYSIEKCKRICGKDSTQNKPAAARVHTWLVHADVRGEFFDAQRPKYLVYTHGNIDNLSFDKRLYKFLARNLGLNVVAWDYPGFGESRGRPSEKLIHESAAAVFKWLVDEKGVDRKDIILWGYSLGGEVSVNVANRFPGSLGVILQAPIDSSAAVAASAGVPPEYIAAITQRFNTSAKIKSLSGCLFLFVGAEDTAMEPHRMRSLYQSAQRTNPSCREYFEVPSLGHLSDPLDSSEFIRKLKIYLKKIIKKDN